MNDKSKRIAIRLTWLLVAAVVVFLEVQWLGQAAKVLAIVALSAGVLLWAMEAAAKGRGDVIEDAVTVEKKQDETTISKTIPIATISVFAAGGHFVTAMCLAAGMAMKEAGVVPDQQEGAD